MCAQRDAVAADAALNSAYRATLARIAPANRPPVVAAQTSWIGVRDKTCDFEAGLTAGGSISPMEHADCIARMSDHQTRQLQSLPLVPAASAPVDPAADADLNRVYNALTARLTTPADRSALISAETAWIAYRDKMCALAGDGCLTRLTAERTAELRSGWIGEPL